MWALILVMPMAFGHLLSNYLFAEHRELHLAYHAWGLSHISKSISTSAQYMTPDSKIYNKMSKCASLAQKIGFSAPNLCSLPWLVKGATQLCTSKKECNKLDLTAAQYFCLVDHNDWSRWFAIGSPTYMQFQLQFLIVGLPKKMLNLDI